MRRQHPAQKDRTVAEVFAEEKERLLPLPEAAISTDLVTSVPSDKTAFISFDGNRYSVPSLYADKTLALVASDTEVRLLDGKEEVARHHRCWGRHQRIEVPEHRAALLAQKSGARDGKGRDRLRAEIPRIDELLRLWLEDGRYVGSLVGRKAAHLLDLYGVDILGAAVERGHRPWQPRLRRPRHPLREATHAPASRAPPRPRPSRRRPRRDPP